MAEFDVNSATVVEDQDPLYDTGRVFDPSMIDLGTITCTEIDVDNLTIARRPNVLKTRNGP